MNPHERNTVLHRILRAATATCLSAGLLGAAPAGASTAESATRCQNVTVPVSIARDQPAEYQVWGQLCVPVHRRATAIQVLVHGLNYSHLYWDFPFQPDHYSYVHAANRAGYATFNLDRIGVSRSSHPASADVTLESNAYTIHQVVTALRGGAIARRAFGTVVLVGHSYGSEIAKLEASIYRDVDALILTGNAHTISPSAQGRLAQLGQPVDQVPRLAAEIPHGDSGYVTVQDATRPEVMYEMTNADPRVVALDIATKETNTLAEIFTIGDALPPRVTEQIRVPILIADGANDKLACAPDATDCSSAATLAAAEQPFYPHAHVDAIVIPHAGHVINLHRNAELAYHAMLTWTNRTLCTVSGTI